MLSRLLSLTLILSGPLLAQPAVLTGRVFDSQTGRPLEYANVVLYNLTDSTQVAGTVTNTSGEFSLTPVPAGTYYLAASFVGYGSATIDRIEVAAGARLDLGGLNLEPTSVPVPGTTTVGDRPAVTFEADKKVIDVAKLPNASSGTAVDALQNAPSVRVDIEGNVTLRGSPSFTVLVDGRPTPLSGTEALKQIPSATIDKIEIITNPSAKYNPEGTAGIINVILKKQRMQGFSALANADAGLRNRYNGDALVSYKTGIVNTYAGGQLGRRVFVNENSSETRTYSGAETLSVQTSGTGDWQNLYGAGRAGIDLQLGPRDHSSVSGRVGMFDGAGSRASSVTETRLPSDSSQQYSTRGGWKFGSSYWFAMADHEHQFDTAGHKLTGRAVWVSRDGASSSGSVRLDSAGDTTRGRLTEEPGPWRRLQFDLEYVLPFGPGGKLEAGYTAELNRVDQEYRLSNFNAAADSFELDPRSSHTYWGTQDNHALYATGSLGWQKLGFQPGLRVEYGTRRIQVTDTALGWQAQGWDFFPTVGLSYSLPRDMQVTAAYSRRIDRPDPWLLRPFVVWQDERTVSVGNPDLLPSYVNSFEAGYSLPLGANQLSLQGYYRTTSNMNEWITSRWTEDTTVLMQRPENIGRDRSLGTEFTANVSPLKWLNAYLTADLYDYREWFRLYGRDSATGSFTWSGSLRLTATLPTSTVFQLSGWYSSPAKSAQGGYGQWYSVSASAKQFLFNRALSITFRCQNLLGPTSWTSKSEGPGFKTSSWYKGEGYILTLALSYNFNNFRLDPKMRAGEGIEQQGGGAGGGAGGPGGR